VREHVFDFDLDGLLPTTKRPTPDLASAGQRAVLFDRAIAALIDLLVCYVLLELPVVYVALELFGDEYAWLGAAAPVLSLVVLVPLYLTYSFAFEWQYGRTPGKVNRGLVVVTTDGRPCTLRASAIRNLLRYVDLLGVPPLVIGLVVAAVSGGQRVGDRVAGTVVVRTRAPGPDDATGSPARDPP
jgi:uncharacterized RDD family membrane protein YckC